jgi:DNA-3-methyladenine glycosylase I
MSERHAEPARSVTPPPEAPTVSKRRCAWAKGELYEAYHDTEWGVPVHDDRLLFELLILEGAQAGLSWITILKKRENYRRAFGNFDARKVAKFGPADVERLLADAGIVRNRLKVGSAIQNAKAFLRVQKEFGTFDRYIWSFVGGNPIRNHRTSLAQDFRQDEPRSAKSRLQICRLDDLLCLYASHRHGE